MTTEKATIFGAYSPRPIYDDRTNGYAGGNDDTKLRKPRKRRAARKTAAPKGKSPTVLSVFGEAER